MHSLIIRWYDIELGIPLSCPGERLKVEIDRSGGYRPRYVIQRDQLLFLRELKFTWPLLPGCIG